MYETILSIEDLLELQRSTERPPVVIDCRFSLADPQWGRKEYEKGHIPGAQYAHLNDDLSGRVVPGITGRHPLPEAERFLAWVENAGIGDQTQVVVYDQGSGGYAARLWWLLRWIGHDAVAVLDGGWNNWIKNGLPVDQALPQPVRAVHHITQRDDLIMTAEAVQSWCSDPSKAIVDARDERRYLGEEETIDPVAGHIPGAINMPFDKNTHADGTWKDSEELHKRFAPLLDQRSCDDVVFYCGSGVTACHDVLAFKHAGLGEAKLFPGSWSEWIARPERGVETD